MDNGFSTTFDHHPDAVEENATHARVQYEDDWVATLSNDGFVWTVSVINPSYVDAVDIENDEFESIDEFVKAIERSFESV